MKPLMDDELSARPLSIIFYRLAGSGQVRGYDLQSARIAKTVKTIFYFVIIFGWGLWTGRMIWGGR